MRGVDGARADGAVPPNPPTPAGAGVATDGDVPIGVGAGVGAGVGVGAALALGRVVPWRRLPAAVPNPCTPVLI